MKKLSSLMVLVVVLLMPLMAAAQVSTPPASTPITQTASLNDAATTTAHSHTTAATLTLTSAPNMYVYVTGMDISNCQAGSAVTAASPAYMTTTGLNGSPQFQIGSGPATAGLCSPTQNFAFSKPLKAQTAGTNVTFVLPSFIIRQAVSVNVYYFVAP